MKKLTLFLLLFGLFLIPGLSVHALEITCSNSKNLLKPNNFVSGIYQPFEYSPVDVGYADTSYNGLIPVSPSTDYSYHHDSTASGSTPYRIAIAYYDSSYNYLSSTNERSNYSTFKYTFTTLDNAYYITLHLYHAKLDTLNTVSYQLEQGSAITDFVEYEECIIEPEPEPIIPDSTLDTFYALFVDKLKLLSKFSVENKFILSAITIIIVLVCLELFLHLIKGGRKR